MWRNSYSKKILTKHFVIKMLLQILINCKDPSYVLLGYMLAINLGRSPLVPNEKHYYEYIFVSLVPSKQNCLRVLSRIEKNIVLRRTNLWINPLPMYYFVSRCGTKVVSNARSAAWPSTWGLTKDTASYLTAKRECSQYQGDGWKNKHAAVMRMLRWMCWVSFCANGHFVQMPMVSRNLSAVGFFW